MENGKNGIGMNFERIGMSLEVVGMSFERNKHELE